MVHVFPDSGGFMAKVTGIGGVVFKSTGDPWFSPSSSSLMINYRIDNMSDMLAQLKQNGVDIVKSPDADENGTFAWVLDPDGNKVELWESGEQHQAK
jgi:predicted enzyme related to lactoylglutathione lyase